MHTNSASEDVSASQAIWWDATGDWVESAVTLNLSLWAVKAAYTAGWTPIGYLR